MTTPVLSPARLKSAGSLASSGKEGSKRSGLRSGAADRLLRRQRRARAHSHRVVEGASWWNVAFEAAGFRNAFQVKVLPADADPMDVRYNMINWCIGRRADGPTERRSSILARARSSRANVRLGSLRIRQDVMIAGGLIPQYDELHDRVLSELDPATSPSLMALARSVSLPPTRSVTHSVSITTWRRAAMVGHP